MERLIEKLSYRINYVSTAFKRYLYNEIIENVVHVKIFFQIEKGKNCRTNFIEEIYSDAFFHRFSNAY